MIHTDRVIDVLHVAPTIWAPILQKENHAGGIWRIVLGVMMFNNLAIAIKKRFDRGMRVTVGALV
jgi:hypothetical protein